MGNSLDFCIEQGIIAGHDVGFDSKDLLIHYMSLPSKDRKVLRDFILTLLKNNSKCPEEGFRIDGFSSDTPNDVWISQTSGLFRFLDPSYEEDPIIQYLSFFLDVSDQLDKKQSGFFEHKLWRAERVKVSSVYDVLSKKQVDEIQRLRPKVKECYRNSLLVSQHFSGVSYVEGMVHSIIPIDHAFNKFEDKYFDITFELVLGLPVEDYPYVSLIELSPEEAFRMTYSSASFGNCFTENYKELVSLL